jgi:hypothetical protein
VAVEVLKYTAGIVTMAEEVLLLTVTQRKNRLLKS